MCKNQWSYDIMNIREHWDERGTLLPIEFDDLPFVPKRLFYVSNIPNGTVRGGHAHKQCRQFFVCLGGEIDVNLDDGTKYKKVTLHPNQAIEIPTMVWSTQEFYKNGIAMVLSSEKYDEKDYVRDYQTFLEIVK